MNFHISKYFQIKNQNWLNNSCYKILIIVFQFLFLNILNSQMQPLMEKMKNKQSKLVNSSMNQRKPMNNFTLISSNMATQIKSEIFPNLMLKNSCIYSTIRYMHNPTRQFISHYSISNQYKSIRNTDIRIYIYFAAISKLFGELKGIHFGEDQNNRSSKTDKQSECNRSQKIEEGIAMKDIWVCQNKITGYPIVAYFTQPAKYAVMECCYKPIYIQFEYQLSGMVKCSNCNKLAFSFIHVSKPQDKTKTRNEKRLKTGSLSDNLNNVETEQIKMSKMHIKSREEKQRNKDKQREREKQKNEYLYKQYKQAYSQKRSNVRKLVSSNQHRYKPLIKYMNNDITNLILKGNDQLGKQNISMNDIRIGQFVIEITQTNLNTDNTIRNKENLEQPQSKHENKQNSEIEAEDNYYDKYLKQYENMSSNCKQTRAIILQIFK